MFLFSYDTKSESARMLCDILGILMIRHENSKFQGSLDKTVINWGSGSLPRHVRWCKVINEENAVARAINKLRFFRATHSIPNLTVPWTTSTAEAAGWLGEGCKVIARTRVKGKDGDGLVLCHQGDILPYAPLYTKFVNAVKEYRITVAFGNVIARQRKVRLDAEDGFTGVHNDDVKTSGNGYGFKWVTRNIPPQCEAKSIQALRTIGLDFGGVDVVWDGENAYVLEVNTAPELTPNSGRALAAAIQEHITNQQ